MSIKPEDYEQLPIPLELYAEAVGIIEMVAVEYDCTGPDKYFTCLSLAKERATFPLCPKCRAEKFLSEHP